MPSPDLVRLHTSENPYGASPGVHAAIRGQLAAVNTYPDGPADELVAAVARHHEVGVEQVSVGNGADEVILFVALALHDDHRPWVTSGATFASYAESVRVARGSLVRYPLRDYRVPVDQLADRLDSGACGAFVCNPHNPAGTVLTGADLETLSAAAARGGGVLVVDEAYAEFAGSDFVSAMPLAADSPHVLVLRTFSKAYGLAGLRVGYAVGSAELVARLNGAHRALPYHVNRLAQHAAVAALADRMFVHMATRRIAETRDWFHRELTALGLHVPPSHTNFVLVDFGNQARQVVAALRERGFLVRDTTDMGLPGHVRISMGTRSEMSELRDHIADIAAAHDAELAA